MLTISRKTARLLRKVFRRALDVGPRERGPMLQLRAGTDGIEIRAITSVAAASYVISGKAPDETIVLPWEFLSDCEGSKDEPIQLERMGDGRIIAGFHDQGVPIVKHYDVLEPDDRLNNYPVFPAESRENGPEILAALRDAMEVVDRDPSRYATGHVRLRGSDGSLAATDGRHLLVQSGFSLLTDGEVLVPRNTVFGSAELHNSEPVQVGIDSEWFAVRTGAWTFHLRITKEGRFPRVDDHITDTDTATARLNIAESDALFLEKALRRLPGEEIFNKPVTVDLNGCVAIRARGEGTDDVTEILLSRSSREGDQVRLNTNRQYLGHALKLGFRDFHVQSPKAPVQCSDDRRKYVWALLEPSSAIGPTDNAVRIESPTDHPVASPPRSNPNRSRTTTMTRQTESSRNSHAEQNGKDTGHNPTRRAVTDDAGSEQHPTEALTQAVALRESLRTAAKQASELVRAIKSEKRHSGRMRSTLASLRSLEAIDA